MRALDQLTVTVFCACLLAFAPSCSSVRPLPEPVRKEKKAAADKAVPTHKTVEDKAVPKQKTADDTAKSDQKTSDDTARQAQTDIANGEYKRALEHYSSAYGITRTPEMRDNYIATGEQIRKAADMAYQRRNFVEAGNIYNQLAESGITERDFAGALSFNEDYLKGQIHACSKALLEAGLTIYRDNKLEDAISIWKQAQTFDRDNKEIKSAIDTATTQLRNLKKLK
jgi:tetratricopeptide (TPR) repeat protein